MNKLSLLACAVFIVGCGTPATYKDPQGRELVVSLDKVNIQDFATAGSQMLQSMISSPSFSKGAPVLQLGSITNDTADNFDTALLLSKITVPLVGDVLLNELTREDALALASRFDAGRYAAIGLLAGGAVALGTGVVIGPLEARVTWIPGQMGLAGRW